MTQLLELRDKIKVIYAKYEAFIQPVIKLLLAFMALNFVNGKLGYMNRLDNVALVLIVGLACSFLPTAAIAFFAIVFSLLHMYALAMEVAAVGLCVYLLMFLLFFRFTKKESLILVLTPLLFTIQIPYVIPVVMGLVGSPVSVISVGCGVGVYYLLMTVSGNASTISTMGDEGATDKLRLMIDGLLGNKALIITITAFAITVVVVYLIRRMAVDYSWTVAIVAGAMVDMLILLLGDLIYDTNISVAGVILGAVASIAVGKIIEFFRHCLDYSRTEKVQFEDDEYYYYVKAVPKMNVAAPTKTVKKINPQRSSVTTGGGSGRSVTMERTVRGTTQRAASSAGYRGDYSTGGRSVTINGENTTRDTMEDYDEVF